MVTNDQIDGIHPVWLAVQEDDGGLSLISTGLRGKVDNDGDFIIPYPDDMAAEEIGCILINTLINRNS